MKPRLNATHIFLLASGLASAAQPGGHLEDPYYGRNQGKAKWIMDREWWYTTQFALPKEMAGKRVRLLFEGVYYECDVWCNSTHLGSHQGMFSSFGFDITRLAILQRENRVMVRLAPFCQSHRDLAAGENTGHRRRLHLGHTCGIEGRCHRGA